MKWSYNNSTNTIWTSFDSGIVEADTYDEARKKAIHKLTADVLTVNKILEQELTNGFRIDMAFKDILVEPIAEPKTSNHINLNENDEYPDYDEFWELVNTKKVFESNQSFLANDWIQIWKPREKFNKGGKVMWSNTLQKVRWTSMSEFYGNGIVD